MALSVSLSVCLCFCLSGHILMVTVGFLSNVLHFLFLFYNVWMKVI